MCELTEKDTFVPTLHSRIRSGLTIQGFAVCVTKYDLNLTHFSAVLERIDVYAKIQSGEIAVLQFYQI